WPPAASCSGTGPWKMDNPVREREEWKARMVPSHRWAEGRTMPKEANWGLVIGAAAVIIIAVLFFRNDGAVGGSANVPGTIAPFGKAPGVPSVPSARTHRVEDGDTLTSIAVKYYGDARHTLFLYRANRDQLLAPDKLPTGVLLVVPDSPPALAQRAE